LPPQALIADTYPSIAPQHGKFTEISGEDFIRTLLSMAQLDVRPESVSVSQRLAILHMLACGNR
jgi:hypothetical protein